MSAFNDDGAAFRIWDSRACTRCASSFKPAGPLATAARASWEFVASAICLQNVPPPVAFTLVGLGTDAAADAIADPIAPDAPDAAAAAAAELGAAADDAAVVFFELQPLSRPAIATAARLAAPRR